jgi:hypothetical protein
LFKSYAAAEGFGKLLEAQLARWLLDHEGAANAPSSGGLVTISPPITTAPATPAASESADPGFDYWIAEADRLTETEPPNYSGALFCAEKALAPASPGIEWVRAKYSIGVAHFYLNNPNESISAFTAVVEHSDSAGDTDEQSWAARALYNKGITLGQLGRSGEEVAVYDDLIARFGSAPEVPPA